MSEINDTDSTDSIYAGEDDVQAGGGDEYIAEGERRDIGNSSSKLRRQSGKPMATDHRYGTASNDGQAVWRRRDQPRATT